jgi:hypothetical protein
MYGTISFVLAERRKVADRTFHSALLARRIVLVHQGLWPIYPPTYAADCKWETATLASPSLRIRAAECLRVSHLAPRLSDPPTVVR